MATVIKSLPTAPPRLKPHELADLATFCDIMHLIHHRNLNQHRHSIWWRSFSVFRREMSHFLSEYTTYQPPTTPISPEKPKPSAKASKVAARRAAARLEAWRKDAVPRWYLAFAELIGSTQFSAIGLVLLAILARVAQVTGITSQYEDEAEQAMQSMLLEFAKKDAEELFGAVEPSEVGPRKYGGGAMGEDLGEVVWRREDAGEVVSREVEEEKEEEEEVKPALMKKRKTVEEITTTLTPPNAEAEREAGSRPKNKKEKRVAEPTGELEGESKDPPKKKKKTKKSKSSAIDDLFAGL